MKIRVHFIYLVALIPGTLYSQKVKPDVKFSEGQVVKVTLTLKTAIAQEAMGQAIEFNAGGNGEHQFTVMRKAGDSIFLHHSVKRISFHFDGMGQKRSYDSDQAADSAGEFNRPMKELLDKPYDIVVDSAGNILSLNTPKNDSLKMSTQMAILANMLKDILEVAQPPAKEQGSFFKVLPRELAAGESWSDSLDLPSGKSSTTYTLTSISDSVIVIDFNGTSTTITKAEMMGTESVTKLNNKSIGKIILDGATGMIREKTTAIESNGSTEALGGTVPVTSKTTITITVGN